MLGLALYLCNNSHIGGDMPNYRPYLTNDGSIGLFSGDFDDIFHSRFGALSEAYEKFVLPAKLDTFFSKSDVNVLDICYGIGYNSKALINTFIKYYLQNDNIKNYFFKKQLCIVSKYTDNKNLSSFKNTESIHGDKNISDKLNYQNKKINFNNKKSLSKFLFEKSRLSSISNNYNQNSCCSLDTSDLKIPKLSIDAIELEKEFVYLSPIIKNICFEDKYKILPIVNELILYKLSTQYENDFGASIQNCAAINQNKRYFDKNMLLQSKKTHIKGYNYPCLNVLSTLLHNIYYRHISKQLYGKNFSLNPELYWYISKRYMCRFFDFLLQNININFFIDDARIILKNLKKEYDLIFLDAFTPAKAPMLWSVQFFELLSQHLSFDGYILTYSKSARVYSAMLKNNLYIGHIKDSSGKIIGTIATKNFNKLEHPLTHDEIAALCTKSGIPYNDNTLSDSYDSIIKTLEESISKSTLPTFAEYKKGQNYEI